MKLLKTLKAMLLLVSVSFSSCIWWTTGDDDDIFVSEPFESRFEAQILNRSEIDNSIFLEDNQEVTESSKIYIVEDYIFINDKYKGFHIFDNSDPTNPVKTKFLNFPGATDIAIRNNTLYVNQATDLVTLNFNLDDLSFTIEKRIANVFPELISPDGFREFANQEEVVVNWILK